MVCIAIPTNLWFIVTNVLSPSHWLAGNCWLIAILKRQQRQIAINIAVWEKRAWGLWLPTGWDKPLKCAQFSLTANWFIFSMPASTGFCWTKIVLVSLDCACSIRNVVWAQRCPVAGQLRLFKGWSAQFTSLTNSATEFFSVSSSPVQLKHQWAFGIWRI